MKGLTLLFGLICFRAILLSQDYQAFEEKGKWGFKQGKKTVIKARFDEVAGFWANGPRTHVRVGNKYAVIDRQGNWYIKAEIDSIREVTFPHNYDLDGQWRIAYGKDYDYILNGYDYSKVDSFPEIQREIRVREKNPYFNIDYSDPKDEYITYLTPPEEPYVIVSRFDERRQPERAVYELTGQKLISPWVPLGYDENLLVEAFHYDTGVLYTYSNGVEKGYYMTGMDYGTQLKFSDLEMDGNFLLLREAAKGSPFQLYQWNGEYLLLLSGTSQVSVSEEEGSARYFYLLEDERGKYGFVSLGGKVIGPEYDTLFRMPGYSDILHTRINGMYGVVSLSSDYELRAKSQVPILIEGYDYTLFNSGIYLSYTDSLGKKWFADASLGQRYGFNPKHVFPKAEKGFYYLTSSDTVKGKRVETRVLESKFLYLDTTRIYGIFKAKGTNKKYGFVNLKGDTLTPFEFEDLDLFNWDGDGSHYIRVKKNGKWALYHYNSRQLIPVYYDRILDSGLDDYDNLIVTAKGKLYGMHTFDGLVVLPQQFERILAMRSQEAWGDYIMGLKKGKYTVSHITNRFLDSATAKLTTKEYDFILKDQGFIRNGDTYEVYDLLNDHRPQEIVSESEISWEEEGNRIAVKNGKLGVESAAGEIIVPFEQDLLVFSFFDKKRVLAFRQGAKSAFNLETGEETPDTFYNNQYK